MSMVMRQGSVKFNPAQDISHIVPALFADVMRVLQEQPAGPIKTWMSDAAVTNEELGEAARAMSELCNTAGKRAAENLPPLSYAAAIQDSGLDSARPEAVVVIFYYMGVKTMAAFYAASRVCADEPKYCFEMLKPLREASDEFLLSLEIPWWRRWISRAAIAYKRFVQPKDGLIRKSR